MLSERRLVTASDNKYQLSLTNQRDALHHGKRAVNKGGRLYPVYTIQPVVKRFEQPDGQTTGLTTGWTTSCHTACIV